MNVVQDKVKVKLMIKVLNDVLNNNNGNMTRCNIYYDIMCICLSNLVYISRLLLLQNSTYGNGNCEWWYQKQWEW